MPIIISIVWKYLYYNFIKKSPHHPPSENPDVGLCTLLMNIPASLGAAASRLLRHVEGQGKPSGGKGLKVRVIYEKKILENTALTYISNLIG